MRTKEEILRKIDSLEALIDDKESEDSDPTPAELSHAKQDALFWVIGKIDEI
jgi:hypothetical protein